MTLVNPDSFSIRSPSPPHAEASEDVPGGVSREGKAAVPRTQGAADKTYQEDAVAHSHLINQSNGKGADPGHSLAEKSVKLCPHENLSFDRVQRILKFKRFTFGDEGTDAIGAEENKQHEKWTQDSTMTCYPGRRGVFCPMGVFKLKYNPINVILLKSNFALALHVTWTLGYYSDVASVGAIQHSQRARNPARRAWDDKTRFSRQARYHTLPPQNDK